MALDTASIPCNLLNNAGALSSITTSAFASTVTSFEDVWLPASATVTQGLAIIFQSGTTMKTFSEILTTTRLPPTNVSANPPTTNTGKMIGTADTSSKFRLISFISNGGVSIPVVTGQAGAGSQSPKTTITYSYLCNILFYNGTNYLSIVDHLFVGASYTAPSDATKKYPAAAANSVSEKTVITGLTKGATYTFSGDTGFTAITDGNLKTLVSQLQTARYLLEENDLYPTSGAQANPGSSSTALISLFQLVAQGTNLSDDQKDSLYELQTRNLRFFAAFLAEYCFYRTRYDWFLVEFFKYYTKPITGTGAYSSSDPDVVLFKTALNITGTGVSAAVTQADLLQGIATQMARLNTRMVDMKRLLNAINQKYQEIFKSVQERINSGGDTIIGSNANVVKATQALSSSAESAEKYLSDAEFRKGIMDYTSEKNRYSNILLSFYAFLNIAALAAIFQLARS